MSGLFAGWWRKADAADATSAANGAGGVGFSYGLGYAAGTLGKWLQDLANSGGAAFVGYILSGVGAIARTLQSKAGEVASLEDFGASTGGTAAANSAAVLLAMAWMHATGGRVRVNGWFTINGDLAVPASGCRFFGKDKFSDGFILAPQSAAIVGGTHAYFLPDSATNTENISFTELGFKSTYRSDTWAGSMVFAVLQCAPNAGVTHKNIRFQDNYFFDLAYTAVQLFPHEGGVVRDVIVDKPHADVTSLALSSRVANIVQCLIEGIDYAGHGTTYGQKSIINVRVTNGYARGYRSLTDMKRGTYKFIVANHVTEDMSDCHHSSDGAFSGIVSGVVGSHTSAAITMKNFVNISGEDLTLTDWVYNGTLGLGSIAAVLAESYAYPAEAAGSFHQPKRLTIKNGKASGINHHAVRLHDSVDCKVIGLETTNVTLSAVAIEQTANALAAGTVPSGNLVDDIKGISGNGAYAVNVSANAKGTRVGEVAGYLGQVTLPNYRPIYPNNENRNPHMDVLAGAVTGWTLTAACTAANNADTPLHSAHSVLVDGTNNAVVDSLSLDNYVRVDPGELVSLRVFAKLGTAAACGVLFQEFTAAGVFIANDFQALTANGATHTENLIYHQASATCGFVRVALLPNTNFNSAAPTGSTYFSLPVITKRTA